MSSFLAAFGQRACTPDLVRTRRRPRGAVELGLAEGFLDEGEALTSAPHGGLVEPRVSVVPRCLLLLLRRLLLFAGLLFSPLPLLLLLSRLLFSPLPFLLLSRLLLLLHRARQRQHRVRVLIGFVLIAVPENIGPSLRRQQRRGLSFARDGESFELATRQRRFAPERRVRVTAPPRVHRSDFR